MTLRDIINLTKLIEKKLHLGLPLDKSINKEFEEIDYRRLEYVGPTVSSELIQAGIFAILIATITAPSAEKEATVFDDDTVTDEDNDESSDDQKSDDSDNEEESKE